MNFYYFFLICFMLSRSAYSATISDERGQVEIDLRTGWGYEKNLLGLGHVFITKEASDRSSLSLTLTGLDDISLPVQALKKNQFQYQDGRKIWAKKHHAVIEKFLPYLERENSAKVKIHSIGFVYKLNEKDYYEKSYYVECPNSFIHLKLLSPKNSIRIKEADEMVQTIKCLK